MFRAAGKQRHPEHEALMREKDVSIRELTLQVEGLKAQLVAAGNGTPPEADLTAHLKGLGEGELRARVLQCTRDLAASQSALTVAHATLATLSSKCARAEHIYRKLITSCCPTAHPLNEDGATGDVADTMDAHAELLLNALEASDPSASLDTARLGQLLSHLQN